MIQYMASTPLIIELSLNNYSHNIHRQNKNNAQQLMSMNILSSRIMWLKKKIKKAMVSPGKVNSQKSKKKMKKRGGTKKKSEKENH